METRTIETMSFDADRPALYSIRWAAVLAGLAVGLGVHLLLMLVGVSAGLVVFGTGERLDGENASLAAAIWNSASLLIAAVIGGYIAARASGLRRTVDGVLHAIASWGASMLCYAVLAGLVAGSVLGNTLAGAFGMAATTAGVAATQGGQSGASAIGELLSSIERGDREGSVTLMRERFGLTPDQAERAADRAFSIQGGVASPGSDADLSDAAQAASATSAWLSLILLLSLAAGAGGGFIGARGSLKRSRPGHYGERRVIHTHTPAQGIPTVS